MYERESEWQAQLEILIFWQGPPLSCPWGFIISRMLLWHQFSGQKLNRKTQQMWRLSFQSKAQKPPHKDACFLFLVQWRYWNFEINDNFLMLYIPRDYRLVMSRSPSWLEKPASNLLDLLNKIIKMLSFEIITHVPVCNSLVNQRVKLSNHYPENRSGWYTA